MGLPLLPKLLERSFRNIHFCSHYLLVSMFFLLLNSTFLSASSPQIERILIENARCGISSGSIHIDLSNTASNYTFDWMPNLGIGTLNSRDSLPGGVYSIIITDINDPSCSIIQQVIIENINGPEAILAFTTAAGCQQATGRAILAPINFNYNWSDGGTGNNRADLLSGEYIVTVTRPTDGCQNVIDVSIEETGNLMIQVRSSQPADCGQSNGQLELIGLGGSANQTYTWSDGGSGNNRNDLAAGTYTITLTDNSPIGCTRIGEFFIAEVVGTPTTLTLSDVIAPTCVGNQNGQIIFTAQYDGSFVLPADTILTDTAGQLAINSALSPGRYCLTIVDGNGCVNAETCFDILSPPALEVDISVTDKGCMNLGEIVLDISGGNGNYIFDWADLPGNNDPGNRGALEPNNYSLTITDANGCLTAINDIVIIENCVTGCQVQSGTISTADPLVYCVDDGADDIIFFQSTGNVGPRYIFMLTDATGTILATNNTNFNLEGRNAGTCIIYGVAFDNTVSGLTQNENISDITGCFELSNGITVTKLTGANCNAACTAPVVSSVVVADASCEVEDGLISIQTLADTSNYQFTWSPNVGNTATIDSLAVGIYTVTISDLNDPVCNLIQTFAIGVVDGPQVEVLSVTPTSCLENNGTALVSPPIYQYDWCGGQTSFNPTDLFAGICYVTVTDPLTMCVNIIDIEIDTLSSFKVSYTVNTAPTCGQANGNVTIEVNDGSTFYSYEWSNGANTANLSGLSAGVYEVTVTDLGPTGCVQVLTFALTETTLNATLPLDSVLYTSCPGAADVLLDLTNTIFDPGFSLPASFEIRDADGNLYTNGQLAPGKYCILIFDDNGCLAGESCFDVEDPDPLTINASVLNQDCNQNGQIALNVAGGTGAYTYDWSDLAGVNDPADRLNLALGTYNVSVTDENGCMVIFDSIAIIDACIPCPVRDSLNVLITANTFRTICVPVETECYDRSLTFFSLQVGGLSGTSAFGNWSLQPQGCLEYTANGLTGSNVDTIYVLAGFNGLSDTTCIFVSITDDLSFNPGADTLYLTTNEETTIDSCLDIRALTGPLATANILMAPVQGALAFNMMDSSCISYTPNVGVTGNFVDSLWIELCDVNNICDTTLVVFSVVPANCPDITVLARDTIVEFDCGTTVDYCLGLELFEIINYQLFVDGSPYAGSFSPCNDSVITGYDLSELLMQFPTGPYVLDTWEVNGQPFSIDTIQNLQQLADSMLIWDPSGQWNFDGQSKIFGGLASSTYGQLVLRVLGSLIQVRIDLFADTRSLGTLIQLPAFSGQLIINELSTACQDTLLYEIDCRTCPVRYTGPDTIVTSNCGALTPLCLEIEITDLSRFQLFDNGQTYTGSIAACSLDSIYTYNVVNLQQGPFQLDSWIVGNDTLRLNSFNNLQDLVDSMNVFDPGGNWQLIGPVITGGASGKIYEALLVSQNGVPFPPMIPSLQQIPRSVSMQLDTGFHQVILLDTISGCNDTLNILVDCQENNNTLDSLFQLFEVEREIFCPDLSAFNNISTINNICPDQSDGNAIWNFDSGSGCFELIGQTLGVDTFCLEVCDTLAGLCDTFYLSVEVLPLTEVLTIDLIIGFTDTICLDTSIFQQSLDTIYNDCPTASGTFADVLPILNTNCIEINAEAIGTDSACIVLCDELGFCDTTILQINITAPNRDTIREVVMIGGQSTYCLDTTELSGIVDTIYNICPDASGTEIIFTINQSTLCIDFEGLDNGLDTACLVFCDDLVCDTTILIVEAIRGSTEPPVAVDDDRLTSRNVQIEIDILTNDTINGTMPEIFILQAPQLGTVQVNPNQTFTYVPDLDVCERVDSFTYILRTSTGEDTATVRITIVCEDLTIFNGFSPNGDQINDTWVIPGIENFPNNKVCVFNRWGNQIFCQNNYLNTAAWDGTWDGKDLPDGTYFYVIDDGAGNQFSGYVQLHR